MFIDKDIEKYLVFSEGDILNALKKISDNKDRIAFSVNESGVLEGVLTDGDFRRWVVDQKDIDLKQPVIDICNKNYKFAWINDHKDIISSFFSKEIQFVPLLDEKRHLIAIAKQQASALRIGDFSLDSSSTFVIAEIGNNHNGDLERAKQLIDYAVQAGANCAKFQLRNLDSLYHNRGNSNDIREDLGSQYTLDLLSKFQLSNKDLITAFDYCKSRNVLPLCTPWDLESLAILEDYGMLAYKVASADLTNHDFLKAIASTGKVMFCSTGMSTESEICQSVALLKQLGANFCLLHCNSTYPAPFKDINLNYLERLTELGECPVGYSGHERDIYVSVAAVAKGAKIIEKHLTFDRNMEGNDHKVSLLPHEFSAMVKGIRQVESALGNSSERQLSQGELMNRETLAKSLIINCDLACGEIITEQMLSIKSPGKGLQPNRKLELIGTRSKRSLKRGDFFFPSDLLEDTVSSRQYDFSRPWGLPVRYHDFETILINTNPDLLEFHLSYKDLEENVEAYFQGKSYDMNLVVHSPELFAGDHTLDLCSPNSDYRDRSIIELQRVIEVTKVLKRYFTKANKPLIVTNVGGFSIDAPLHNAEIDKRYELLLDSLSRLEQSDVEIIPQTMPPFPWHFGGQRHHNLFVNPQEIADFCKQYNYRICLDISHSQLACNHYKYSMRQFIQNVAPFVAHLHIADAKGVDGEGLQVGDGDIIFSELAKDLNELSPQASFIPEIWQGHKNEGEGFWIALNALEQHL